MPSRDDWLRLRCWSSFNSLRNARRIFRHTLFPVPQPPPARGRVRIFLLQILPSRAAAENPQNPFQNTAAWFPKPPQRRGGRRWIAPMYLTFRGLDSIFRFALTPWCTKSLALIVWASTTEERRTVATIVIEG